MIEKIQDLIQQYNTNHLPVSEMSVVLEHNEFVVEVWDIEEEKCTQEESFLDADKMVSFIEGLLNVTSL